MKNSYSTLLVILILITGSISAHDTITFMHYNLLYYGKETAFCNFSDDDMREKSGYLKKIVQYTQPDVLTVNELDGSSSYPLQDDGVHLLDNALNADGETSFRKAPYGKTYLASTLFYNSNKLRLQSYKPIVLHVGGHEKIFNVYTFYYHADDLSVTSDTTFLSCFVIHLKSGTSDQDSGERANEAEVLMDYIENVMSDSGNYIICGDLNVYSSDEEAYQIFTTKPNASYRFHDPLNQPGNWHDNEKYRLHHTQSTHSSGECFSGGGMDDRFDFILLSGSIMEGAKRVGYLPDSYETVGQDGGGFNADLNTEDNATVPIDIAQALYAFSDHLPVKLNLRIDKDPAEALFLDSVYHLPYEPLRGDSTRIYAQFTDTENLIATVRLSWGNQSRNYQNHQAMNLSGNYYSSAIERTDQVSNIYYRVHGYDLTGEEVISSTEQHIMFAEDTTLHIFETDYDLRMCNPVEEQMMLFLTECYSEDLIVEIVDVTGQVRFRRSYPEVPGMRLQIPVSFLQSGIYWVRIQNIRAVATNMFVKQ